MPPRDAPIWMLAVLGLCGLACDTGGDTLRRDTGLEGQVLAGPICPVERPDDSCPDRPFHAVFYVLDAQERHRATFESDEEGFFLVLLAPGDYIVVPDASAPLLHPESQQKQVAVRPDRLTRVTLLFDTGIR